MIVNTGEGTFQKDVLDRKGLVLVDFWAPWCGPCKMIAPVLEQVAAEYQEDIEIAKLNVDDHSAIAQRYKIMSIPTMILFKDGKPVDGAIGMRSKDYFEELIRKHK
ncbi:thioredoxin [Proteiniclasticum sp. C24MP]|uniref:thioredoxin n=1 Tax=Proteiniclasticum sp. C24MP TaxID=3374101 RepID=UPI0037550DB2